MAYDRTAALAKLPEQQRHVTQHGKIFELPDFTIKDVYDAIPPHCFKSSAMRSMLYVARDLGYMSILAYASSFIQYIHATYARAFLWTGYTVVQGMVFTGIWILAHECGHGAFSKHKKLNWAMGLLMHSFLLVPFHSWRISHRAHYTETGNRERDTAFVPRLRKEWIDANFGMGADTTSVELSHLVEDAPVVVLWNCLVHQLLGWPGYLLFNVTGQKYHVPFPKQSHFYPGQDSPLYKKEQLPLVVLSDIGVISMIAILAIGGYFFGSVEMLRLYVVPYLWVNHWIVAITFLHHTDGSLPHYRDSTWTFVRGATATIDRDFGFIDKHLFHNIVGTHVCHHLISTIPFYHAGEASIAIRKVMGRHYRSDTKTPFMSAFLKSQKECKFIEESVDGSGVYFFRNLHGVGVSPKRLSDNTKVEM